MCGLCFWRSNSSEGMQRDRADSTKSEAFSLIQTKLKSICTKSSDISGQAGKLDGKSKVWQLEELKLKLKSVVDEETSSDLSFMHRLGEACQRSTVYTAAGPVPAANVPLLTKKALRSRQDARSGRMNILMQPKTLPLEGDSSLKLQKGKWWVKDSSAVQDLPFVSIVAFPTCADLQQRSAPCILALCLTNPKASDIAVSFRADTVNPGAVDYMRYCSGTGESLWVRNGDHNHMCLQVSRELCTEGEDAGALDIVIGAFEDELLKDASEHVTVRESTAQEKQHVAASPSDTSTQQWAYRVVHNKAYVYIPVSIADNSEYSDVEGCGFEVNLMCRLNLGGAAAIDLPFKVIFR